MYICPYCSKEFKSKKGLGKHLNSIHIDKKTIKYEKCKNPSCNNIIEAIIYDKIEFKHSKNCCSRECYNEYIKFSRKKDIECKTCNKHFTSITEFKKHTCFKDFNFKCKYCNNEYDSEGKLRNHIFNKHKEYVNEINIKCKNPSCNNYIKTLKVGDYIKPHKNTCSNLCLKEIHSINQKNRKKEKIIKCPACKCEFMSIESLKEHFKTRHQKDDCEYECLICKAKFKNISQLNCHYYQYHKGLIKEEKVKCKNPNCNKFTTLLKIKEYIIKPNKDFCSRSCASKINATKNKYWETNKSLKRRYKLTLQNNGTCKWYDYIDKFNNKHRVQGSYELAFAKMLDNMDIKFITHPKGIKYIINNKLTYYFPDFYIPHKNLYIDTKARYYLDLSGDKFKVFREQNPNVNLLILTEDLLECYGINKDFIYENLNNYNK